MNVLGPADNGLSEDFKTSALPLVTKLNPLNTVVTFKGV
jgi:hypothetical protein